ncbi:MAG: tRNA (N(6)-L-threonylcarbamoyladenosine(37)-C(2))-methylthiotransferase MtaB [Candidatus Omnitrophota bacterium]|nr:MAG: tRNA (N(6)-L-threonylcarbamoyladenosine(37)-C(2))-methylthiotransferase MtaB [Candidatus Omnitrophota bacterium]
MNFPARPTFIIKTLGCKVNQYESQAMRENLAGSGFVEKMDGQIADFYIINSCTVTRRADKDTRSLIHHFHKINPDGKIVVAGCYSELKEDRDILRGILGVTHLIRNREKGKIATILGSHVIARPVRKNFSNGARLPSAAGNDEQITDFKDRNRAFIKVQDGCNHKCSYCKVSLVRGPSKSRSTEDILREARAVIEKGFKEIVLTGICLGAWGRDMAKKINLSNLVKEISQIDGLFRIRLSSIEPIYVTGDIINALKGNDKVCKHLHMPLQSGDNRILRAMKRPYTREKFAQIIGELRKHIPDIAITTDILVGFPGEDDKCFNATLKFIEDIKPSRMHVFSYSKRDGTPASRYRHSLNKKEIKKRVEVLTGLSRDFSADFARDFIGKIQDTVIESHRDGITGFLTGYTDRYIRIFVDGPDSLKNNLVPVKIMRVDKNMVFACRTGLPACVAVR